MKNKTILGLTLICTLAFISSCTVQKRIHRSGYHVVWNKKHQSSKANESKETELAVKDIEKNAAVVQVVKHEKNDPPAIVVKEQDYSAELSSTTDLSSDAPLVNETSTVSSQKATFEVTAELKNTADSQLDTKKSEKSKKSSNQAANGGKLQIVALILCIIFGLIGVHRFYLGYTGLGVLYLLTLGLFGIGWIIDIILLIIPNGLTPKGRNNYKE